METSTSFGVCTPRYIRENPTSKKAHTQKKERIRFFACRASGAKSEVAPCVCPLGNEYPVAAGTALFTG